jgi:hypothetical protein
LIPILKEIKNALDHQTDALEGIAREQAAAVHVFEKQLGTISADVKILLHEVHRISTRLGITEEEIDELKMARIREEAGRGGNGNGHDEEG